MPGLLRGVARTAVIAGTATTVSNRVSRRQANKWAAQDQPQEQYAPPPPPPAAAAAQGAGRPEEPGNPHRGRVRGPEGQDPGGELSYSGHGSRVSGLGNDAR